ncbi:MAG TPA: hypothetical protein VNH11_16880 [Pirellulales bacterium]|nr:hypothetical protein [Pirellulales bacterium]
MQLHDWKQSPTLSVASDLVSVALTLGLDQIAIEAANYVVGHPLAPDAARSIALIYLGSPTANALAELPGLGSPVGAFDSPRLLTESDGKTFVQIHRVRKLLSDYPRNPIQWCNLALLYTSFGVLDKAEHAMKVALSLAPQNRLILRSAARFFLHDEQGDRAHRILVASPLVQNDPWILAAEIATADAMNRTSRLIKRAKRLLENGRFSDFHASELASAVGTIELSAGKIRSGRRLVEASLREPSENAVAQAAWLCRNVVSLTVPQLQLSPEAAAFRSWEREDWVASIEKTEEWQRDQPFSSRPAIHGSFIATTASGDLERALAFAEVGLRSNPNDYTLLNNYAVAAAMKGDDQRAEATVRRIRVTSLNAGERVAYIATKGLIAFRADSPELGRVLYLEAISLARAIRDTNREAIAKVYLAMEEARNGSPGAGDRCREAIDFASSRLPGPLVAALRLQVRRRLEQTKFAE